MLYYVMFVQKILPQVNTRKFPNMLYRNLCTLALSVTNLEILDLTNHWHCFRIKSQKPRKMETQPSSHNRTQMEIRAPSSVGNCRKFFLWLSHVTGISAIFYSDISTFKCFSMQYSWRRRTIPTFYREKLDLGFLAWIGFWVCVIYCSALASMLCVVGNIWTRARFSSPTTVKPNNSRSSLWANFSLRFVLLDQGMNDWIEIPYYS